MAGTIGVGIIGLGFMGRTHLGAVRAAEADGLPCRLVAVADRESARLTGRAAVGGGAGNLRLGSGDQSLLFDPARVRAYDDAAALIADPGVSVVSICTHTDTHVDLAVAALRAGKHVLVEKPVSLRSEEVRRLAAEAARADRLAMPAMCMRFWPGWAWLRERVRDGSLGAVRSATFQRLGVAPDWTPFYADVERSGGPLFDLHIHDADFVRWCFGEPAEVVSTGSPAHVTTLYRFGGSGGSGLVGPAHVVAEGGQDLSPGFGFVMRYVVAFEKATADFDLTRSPQVRLTRQGRAEAVEVPVLSAYDAEIRHMVGAVEAHGRGEKPALRATMEDAALTTALIEAERESLRTRRAVRVG